MQCKQKSGSVRLRGDTRFAYTVSAPMFAYLLIVLIIPVCWGLYISFTDSGRSETLFSENAEGLRKRENFYDQFGKIQGCIPGLPSLL